MADRIERTISIALTLSAMVIAVALARREFFPAASSPGPETVADKKPTYVEQWREIAAAGSSIGSTKSPIVIVEFADLECPFCKVFHEGALRDVRNRFVDKISVSVLHFPIQGHRFARPAARAAECARAQGRLSAFIDAAYMKQDSLGLKTWQSYAVDAEVQDTSTLTKCLLAENDGGAIDSGVAIGNRLGIKGTPTIMVNGWLFSAPPSDSALSRVIEALLSDRTPDVN